MRARAGWFVALVFTVSCSGAGASRLPDIDAISCPTVAAPRAAVSSLPALGRLAARERDPLAGQLVHVGHGAARAEPPITLPAAATRALGRELRAAADAACRLRTPEDARRAGYVVSSVYTQGVGTHWTNWRLVDAPFDAAQPSMLLYAPRFGTTQLAAFSYWTRSDARDGPAGFTGTADHWHRHYGLCFDDAGMLVRENVQRAAECKGTWLNGTDIWMLHAWVVPGAANVWGVFAALNPQLCDRTVPDIARCPDH